MGFARERSIRLCRLASALSASVGTEVLIMYMSSNRKASLSVDRARPLTCDRTPNGKAREHERYGGSVALTAT